MAMQPVPERAGVLAGAPGPSPWRRFAPAWARGTVKDSVYAIVLVAFGLAIPLLFALILVRVGGAALPSVRAFGWTFLTSSEWNPVAGEFGAAPFIFGTIASSMLRLPT